MSELKTSLLPSNATQLERDLEQVSAHHVDAIDVAAIKTIKRPLQCPEHLLPWLAWELSVDYWRDDWTLETKRNVVAASIEVHRKKGTKLSLQRVLEVTGITADILKDRYAADYTPHSFDIQIPIAKNPDVRTGKVDLLELLTRLDTTQSSRDNGVFRLTEELGLDNPIGVAVFPVQHAAAEPTETVQADYGLGGVSFFFLQPCRRRTYH